MVISRHFSWTALRSLLGLAAGIMLAVTASGQSASEEAPETVFTHRVEGGLSLHTRGMGGHVEWVLTAGWAKSTPGPSKW